MLSRAHVLLVAVVTLASAQTNALDQRGPSAAIPNRTKVVRLIVVPTGVEKDLEALRRIVISQSAAKTDAFIVAGEPMSLVDDAPDLKGKAISLGNGSALLNHHDATRRDSQTIVFIVGRENEQVQWESSVEFEITRIVKVNETVRSGGHPAFVPNPKAPAEPFGGRVVGARGGPGKPIRSGLADARAVDQLYKLTFTMVIDGRKVVVDPDIFCDF